MRISAKNYIPQLSFRFSMTLGILPGLQFYGKAAQLPKATNNVLTVGRAGYDFKVKGKTQWEDITLTLYNYEGSADTLSELYIWWTLHHRASQGTDLPHSVSAQELTIKLHDAADSPSKQFKLVDAFISSIDLGQVDFENDKIHELTLDVAYDYAEWS